MPEGDTVWLAARRLDAALAGRTLRATDFRVPHLATIDLSGADVLSVVPRGKHLLFRLRHAGRSITLHTHFRMDGSWHIYPLGSRWRGPAHQVRVLLRTDRHDVVGFRLPVVELLPTDREVDVVGHLGPDLLADDVDLDAAAQRLCADPSRPVGDALLDQRCVAGIGNLYRAETLFLAGVTPFTAVGTLPEHGTDGMEVLRRARDLMTLNRNRSPQITTGVSRSDSWHWVFERDHCLRCRGPVSTAMTGQATRERIAYWCPSCQRGPSAASVPVRRLLPPTIGRTRYRP